MATKNNIGEAILILGSLYLGFIFGWGGYNLALLLLVLMAVFTWSMHAYSDLQKRYLQAQVRILEAKAQYWEKKANGL